jgi:hypothetical protein
VVGRARVGWVAGLVACAAWLIPVAPVQAAGGVRLAKIYYNSPGYPDQGGDASLNGEWVMITNSSSRPVVVTGWTLADAARHVFTFPAMTLRAGTSVTVHTGSGTNTSVHVYQQSRWYIWNNDKDTATLRDARSGVVDTCAYSGRKEVQVQVAC